MTMGDDNTYNKFIVMHPEENNHNTVIYDISNKGYILFNAVIGLTGSSSTDSVTFKIYVDDFLKVESEQTLSEVKQISIDVQNRNKLKIEIYDDVTNHDNHAVIAKPEFTCSMLHIYI